MSRREKDQRRKYISETNLDTGVVIVEKWIVAERLHRNPAEGPALIERFDNGTIREVGYYMGGKLHREDGPASVRYAANGLVVDETYAMGGMWHRDAVIGPAYIMRYENGVVCAERYCMYGDDYRDPAQGPYYTSRKEDGTIEEQKFSEPHRRQPKSHFAWRQAVAKVTGKPPTP
jgi:hypothetical protein